MIKKMKKLLMGCLAVSLLAGSMASAEDAFASADTQSGYSAQAVSPSNLSAQGYDVVFCIDNSGSIWSQQAIRDNALKSIADLAVGSDIRIGGVYFADTVCKTQGLTSMTDKEGSQQVLSGFLNMTEQDPNNKATNMGNALEAAVGLFENQSADRNRIVILFSDGINEDVQGSAQYKAAADAKTEEQAKILESKGIPIYCVYLQKARNDEAYLKNLVNYFNTENSYDEERFKKVTDAQISQLQDQFVDIFYDMQNNMKYKEITIDSTGQTSFYVPSVGVEKIQLYLNNPSKFEAELHNVQEELGIKESWGDGSSAYVTIEDPVTGDWTLSVTGENVSATKGTIAYYADLSAYTEILRNGVSVTSLSKNDVVQVAVHFYDEEGNEVAIDPAIQVQAEIVCEGVEPHMLTMQNENGVLISDEYTVQDYGNYAVHLNVVYEDFLDLEYKQSMPEVVPGAPYAYHQSGTFLSEKTEEGQLITFHTYELFSDPENETVKIIEVNQINESNPVEIKEQGDVISVYAKKMGDVKFSIKVEDSSGLATVVNIEGKVINKGMTEIFGFAVIVVILWVIISILRKNASKKRLGISIKNKKSILLQEIDTLLRYYKKQMDENEELFDEEVYLDAMNSVRELAKELAEEEIELYKLDKFMQDPQEVEAYKTWKEAGDNIEASYKALQDMKTNAEGISTDVVDTKVSESIDKYEKERAGYEKKLPAYTKQYKISAEELDEYIGDAGELYVEITEMLDTPITCDLSIQWSAYRGAKKANYGKNKYLKGSYAFDDLMISGPNGMETFREQFSDRLTGIMVYGYKSENGENGLEFRRNQPFDFRHESESSSEAVTKAILLKDETYRITLPRHGSIKIKVK